MPIMVGTVFLVVGASGVGKDSLLDAARAALPEIEFVRRYITRAADSVGEDHIEVTPLEFERMAESGEFCVWWRAHELGYGIHRSVRDQVRAGTDVVINTSRGSIADFERAFERVITIHVTATPDNLRERLLARGRETPAQIDARLSRPAPALHANELVEISNDGDIRLAVASLIDVLRHSSGHRATAS